MLQGEWKFELYDTTQQCLASQKQVLELRTKMIQWKFKL